MTAVNAINIVVSAALRFGWGPIPSIGVAGIATGTLAARLAGGLIVIGLLLRGRSGELNNAIQLEIELKGLGSAGPDTEGRLRRAILGYYREDLSLVPPPQTRGGGELPSSDSVP